MWNRRKTVIIAGCSRFGASLAGEVSEHGNNVIVVEKDGGAFRKLPANFSGFQIVGNVLDPDVLEEAGIWKASVVVAATNDDNVNCMLAQMARRIYDVDWRAEYPGDLSGPFVCREVLGIEFYGSITIRIIRWEMV